MQDDVENILLKIKEKKTCLVNFKNKTEEEIETLENHLRKICDHDWHIDYTNYGEKTEFICSKCRLYKF